MDGQSVLFVFGWWVASWVVVVDGSVVMVGCVE
jgi:hypothetical protein